MSKTELTHAAGQPVVPASDADWQDWVTATSTRNYMLGNPLTDWLDLYGAGHGFVKDTALSTYDSRTDFTRFIFQKAHDFESAVLNHLKTHIEIVSITEHSSQLKDVRFSEAVFDAMQQGVPALWQAPLRNASEKIYGIPDLLIRSDVLAKLFPGILRDDEASVPAPDLGSHPWHYRVIDLKFSTLHLLTGGELGNSGSAMAYKGQLYMYNLMLGKLQGFAPAHSYLLGRSWEQTRSSVTSHGVGCMEKLAPVSQNQLIERSSGSTLQAKVVEACAWIRQLRKEGGEWQLFPKPSVAELWPDMKEQQDFPWHNAKKEIGERLQDLTMLWQVGSPKRYDAHKQGVYNWRDPRVTPAIVGVNGPDTARVLSALLEVNRSEAAKLVMPERIAASEDVWRAPKALEFYVDFETVSDLNDSFSAIPQKGGQPLIFMIGCGHIENGQWQFKCFTTDAMTESSEAAVIDSWLAHMETVRQQFAPELAQPLVIHWSPAETINLVTAYNSASQRHPDKQWPLLNWFDFLNKVIKKEPVVIRGAMGFGLKAVAKSMHKEGLIVTSWADGITDGMGAMVGAWWCQAEAEKSGQKLIDIDLMKEIVKYNEVDCKVMMEAIAYFRRSR